MPYGTVGMRWGVRQTQATMYGCIGCALHKSRLEGERGLKCTPHSITNCISCHGQHCIHPEGRGGLVKALDRYPLLSHSTAGTPSSVAELGPEGRGKKIWES